MHSRGDLCLHEDEDEDEQSGEDAGEHHPDRKLAICAQWVDNPTALIRARHRKASRYTQFLQD